jgi:hypothetical protein
VRLTGIVIVACASALAGCRWPAEDNPQPYTSDIAQPMAADREEPPEASALPCTDEGFTLVVGPEPGCASIDGIVGRGRIDAFGFESPPPEEGTPLRVIRRGTRAADVEVIVHCRPFFNDATQFDLVTLGSAGSCFSTGLGGRTRCDFVSGPIEMTLSDLSVLELVLHGEGVMVDLHACTRTDP